MDISIHYAFLPHTDPDAALAFYRDTLGFEVRNDVGYGGLRWITVGPPGQPGTSIVLHPPGADPGVTDEERRAEADAVARSDTERRVLEQDARAGAQFDAFGGDHRAGLLERTVKGCTAPTRRTGALGSREIRRGA